jgi:hypothetical protein
MKHNLRYFFVALVLFSTTFFACKKQTNPFFANGSAPVLTSSATSITPAAGDSNKVVVTFSWSNPKYATDSTTQKFILEIDSSGRNFSKEVTMTVNGALSYSLTGNQLNAILAGFGFASGTAYKIDIRVTSSYANNNEQYRSNVLTVTVTPYVVPITLTPSSTSPLTLLLSNATNTAISFSWNPSPYGADVINYALQVDTVGGNFKSPQVFPLGTALTSSLTNNDLNTAAIAAGIIGGATKNAEFRIVSYLGTTYSNPLAYSNVIPITLTSYTAAPTDLYIVGDATPESPSWTNSSLLSPYQKFTKINAVSFGIIINLTAGKGYVFLPVDNGDWTHKYGSTTDGTASGGATLLADNAVPNSNTPAPATSGLYEIIVNFQTNTFTVEPYTGIPLPSSIVPTPPTLQTGLWIIGDATPQSPAWTNTVTALASQQFTQISNAEFQITIALQGGKGYVFVPAAGDWNNKYGGTTDGTGSGGGTLLFNNAVPSSNTPSPATSGNYLVDVNFITGIYTVTPK